jgi:hypothetical protein
MKFKSQLVTQVSGSIGGLTGAHNKGGMYFRARAIPTNPGSAYQTAVRAQVAALSTRWGEVLTAAQRTAWETYAQNVPLIDSLGEGRNVTGMNMYVRSNTVRGQCGFDYVDDGPTTMALPSLTPPSGTVTAATAVIAVVFDDAQEWCDEDEAFLAIYGSRQQGPAINYFRGPYRLADTIDGDSVSAPTTPQNVTNPFAVAAGNYAHCLARLSRADGRLSAPIRFRCLSS